MEAGESGSETVRVSSQRHLTSSHLPEHTELPRAKNGPDRPVTLPYWLTKCDKETTLRQAVRDKDPWELPVHLSTNLKLRFILLCHLASERVGPGHSSVAECACGGHRTWGPGPSTEKQTQYQYLLNFNLGNLSSNPSDRQELTRYSQEEHSRARWGWYITHPRT